MEEKKHDEEKEREKDNIDEEIYHDEIFFGDDALACENKKINK